MTLVSSRALEYKLLDRYVKQYTVRYGKAPIINRYRSRWGFKDVLDSVGLESAYELIDYYFKLDVSHNPQWFFNNFDRLGEALEERRKDAERTRILMEKTRRMVESEH